MTTAGSRSAGRLRSHAADEPIRGTWGEMTQDPVQAIWIAGAVFLGIGIVNAVLVGWAREKGIQWDVRETREGVRFAARFEAYENNPAEVSSPDELVTTVAIRIAD